MKKYLYLVLIIFISNFFMPGFANSQDYIKKVEIAKNIYKVKDKTTKKWKIINSDNNIILDGNFDKVYVSKIDKDKTDEYDNLIFYGLYDTGYPVAHIYIPKYPSSEFLKNFYKTNNEISNIKFYDYPDTATFVIQHKNKYGFISIKDDKYIFVKPKYNYLSSVGTGDSSIVFETLGILLCDISSIHLNSQYVENVGFFIDEFGVRKTDIDKPIHYFSEETEIENGKLIVKYIAKKDIENKYYLFPNYDSNTYHRLSRKNFNNINGINEYWIIDRKTQQKISKIQIIDEDILKKYIDIATDKNTKKMLLKTRPKTKYVIKDTAIMTAKAPIYAVMGAISVPSVLSFPFLWPLAFFSDNLFLDIWFWYL